MIRDHAPAAPCPGVHDPSTARHEVVAALRVPDLGASIGTVVVAGVSVGIGVLTLAMALTRDGGATALPAAAVTVVATALFLAHFGRPEARPAEWRGPVTLLGLLVLGLVPVLAYGSLWLGLPVLLGAGVLLAVPPLAAVPLFVLIVAGTGVAELAMRAPGTDGVSQGVLAGLLTAVLGLAVFGVGLLARLAADLHSARENLLTVAAVEERERFARDAHDLMGISLSSIAVKSELALRLVGADEERAAEELDDVLGLSRRALGELRMIASGRADVTLERELLSARSVLEAARIECTVPDAAAALAWPATVSALFATAVREAVTNVLRHARAEHVTVSLWENRGQAHLSVWNDGARSPEAATISGHGLQNLVDRANEMGGSTTAAGDRHEAFAVTVAVPLGS